MELSRLPAAWDDAVLRSGRLMALETLLLFAAFAVAHYAFFTGHPYWTDADSPYHHLVMQEIHAHGWWRDITWLPYTILREAGPDHHWLWHLLLSPLAAIDDLPTRIDVMNAVSFALVPAATGLALRLLGVRFAPVWVLVMVGGTTWALFRWSQVRAQNPAIALMVLFFVALEKRNRIALFLVPFVFMQTYHGAAMLGAPGVLYFLLSWARERKADVTLVLLPAMGGALALVLSPWYPHNIEYFLFHTIDKVGNKLGIDVGGEWYPPVPLEVIRGLSYELAALAVVLVGAGTDGIRRRLSPLTLAAFAMSLLAIAMTLQRARFIEYCPPLLLLTAALVVRDCADRFRADRLRPAFVGAVAVACVATFAMFLHITADIREKPDNDLRRNANVGQLLSHFAAPGSVIVNEAWSDFPTLLWHAPGLRYLTGLDPYYLYYTNPDMMLALYRLRGYISIPAGMTINAHKEFHSDWVVTGRPNVVRYLLETGQAKAVMKDMWNYVVYVGPDPAMRGRLLREGTRWMMFSGPYAIDKDGKRLPATVDPASVK